MRTSALLFLFATAPWPQAAQAPEPKESTVQLAVLDSLFTRDSTRLLVVGDSTVSGGDHFVSEDYASALRTLGALPEGVRADFEAKRGVNRRVDSLQARVPVRRFTSADRELLQREDNPSSYWQAFYRRFPGSSGLIHVSRVGFSHDRGSALLLVEYGCGGSCGGTLYVLLAERSGRWQVVRVAQPRIA